MMSCAQFADRLGRAAVLARNELDIPTEALMVLVEAQAREAIGTYNYGWKPLALYTQIDRVAHGYPADEPLLRTGELAASIKHKAELAPGGAEGVVYSDDKIALFQEMGTIRIPPRSFLYKSMWLSTIEAHRIFGAFAVKLLTFG
jgi:hypothetical protein